MTSRCWCHRCFTVHSNPHNTTHTEGATTPMASHLDLRRKALTVAVTIVAILVWGSDVRAQTKKTANSNTTTGNASWDQAISVLQAQIDQQAAAIAQLQAALGGETTARQQA